MARTPELFADRTQAFSLVEVSRETARRLDEFVALFLKWQQTLNLVAASTLPHLWTRHIADSLQLVPLAASARSWVDLGSGSGFPGLVIACALANESSTSVHLIESNIRKAAFLRECVRVLKLPALVHARRIEDFGPDSVPAADVITARALAPLQKLLFYAEPFLERGAQALFLKGQDVEAELTEAAKYWMFEADLVASRTSRNGRIVVIRTARRR